LQEMGYDALLVSSLEFGFGEKFLEEVMSEYKLDYLSANLEKGFIRYKIKKFQGKKIALIGVTDNKVAGLTQMRCADPLEVLPTVIKEAKEEDKADLVIVLSYLSEEESKNILNQIKGVDIWVSSDSPFMSAADKYINGTLLITPAWETRKLTKVDLNFSTLKVEKVEHIELNAEIKDDPAMASIIPGCFTDKNCKKAGFASKCLNAATKQAKCEYFATKPIKITVIKPSICKTCNIEAVLGKLNQLLLNLDVQYLDAGSQQAQELINRLGIKMLPVYLLEKIDAEETKAKISQISKKVEDYYLLEPGFTGVSFIVGRQKIPNRLDIFFDTDSKNIVEILGVLKALKNKRRDIDIRLNFLAVTDPQLGLIAKGGKYELEEFLRSACVAKYYSDKLFHYISCSFTEVGGKWWDDCAQNLGIDREKIKACAQSEEGRAYLEDFIKLTQELEIVFGPTFLINNQEISSFEHVPTVEELENMFVVKDESNTETK
jgi:hypothetical protein